MSLMQYQTAYKNATERTDSLYTDPPVGDWECKILKTEYKEIVKNGSSYDRFTWDLEITCEQMKGVRFSRVEFLPPNPEDAEKKLSYIKGTCTLCGIRPAVNITDLPQSLRHTEGAIIQVKVIDTGKQDKSGKNIRNVKFLKCIQQPNEAKDDYFPEPVSGFPF